MEVKNTKSKQSNNNTDKESSSKSASETNNAKKAAEKKTSVKNKTSDKNTSIMKPKEVKQSENNKKTPNKAKNKTASKKESSASLEAEVKNLHEGHRQRVKERFLKHGLDSFTSVQFLETLLFYAVPKKDTNETAHLLINKFGSLRKVFAASYDELIQIKGVGENAASLIKFFQMGSKKYMELSFEDEDEVLVNNPEKLMKYCQGLFLGMKKEAVYVIALDADLAIINVELLCSGESDKAWISFRKLAEFCYKNTCTRIAIAHNHPSGIEIASRNDMNATEEIAEFLYQIEVELVDHIIVGKGGAVSLRKEHSDEKFWKKDYSFLL